MVPEVKYPHLLSNLQINNYYMFICKTSILALILLIFNLRNKYKFILYKFWINYSHIFEIWDSKN